VKRRYFYDSRRVQGGGSVHESGRFGIVGCSRIGRWRLYRVVCLKVPGTFVFVAVLSLARSWSLDSPTDHLMLTIICAKNIVPRTETNVAELYTCNAKCLAFANRSYGVDERNLHRQKSIRCVVDQLSAFRAGHNQWRRNLGTIGPGNCIRAELRYSEHGCRCRLNKGGILFGRTRYQQGSLILEQRRRGPAVWVYRWWEKDTQGKPVRGKAQLGSLEKYPNESSVQAAADVLRLTINDKALRRRLNTITIATLVQHYREHEMPDIFSKKRPSIGTICEHEEGRKTYSTQETYEGYLKKWVVPKWGTHRLADVKTTHRIENHCSPARFPDIGEQPLNLLYRENGRNLGALRALTNLRDPSIPTVSRGCTERS
jgi:hypothetical protein